jgi:YVTN family beta-propeller protein
MLFRSRRIVASFLLVLFSAGPSLASADVIRPAVVGGSADGGPALLPTGQYITPTLAPGSAYQRLSTGLRPDGNADADSAMSSAISPDGKTLLVLTSGFNTGENAQTVSPPPAPAVLGATNGVAPPNPLNFPAIDPLTGLLTSVTNSKGLSNGPNQTEFVFIYDVSSGSAIKRQQILLPDSYSGLAWDPAGNRFYVSGGIDDRILIYKNTAAPSGGAPNFAYAPDAPFIILNHNPNDTLPVPTYKGGSLATTPLAKATGAIGTLVTAITTAATVAGFDISRDGKTIVAANFHNASASIIDTTTRKVITDVVFTPAGTINPLLAVGEMPFWVSVKSYPATGAYAKAYVTSQRDDQVVVLTGGVVTSVIAVPSGPGKSVLDGSQRYLYVACGNDDSVAVIDTVTDKLVRTIALGRPGDAYKGAIPNSVAIGGYGTLLYVTLGGWNALAVVDINRGCVVGRIPTGWLPTSVSVSPSGKRLFVVNEKSTAGPNTGNLYYSWNTSYGAATNPTYANEYTWELEKSGLTALPLPDSNGLAYLTNIVDVNNNFPNENKEPGIMRFLRTQIKHVIYIVNENRTFDQVLGDLGNGSNGDPRLTFFPQPITPNLHALAANYVTLDNFYDSSETSGVGWNWAMQGHTNDYVEKTQPVDYGNGARGFTYDWQGIVNNINLGLPATGGSTIFTTRITGILDPSGHSNILPGFKDPSATEGANNLAPQTIGGYIWESVLRRYGPNSVRNYGWQIDLNPYSYGAPLNPPLIRNPYATGTLEAQPSTPSIQAVTDRFYRAFDQNYPDIFRIEEWTREFNYFVAHKNLPALEVMTIPHDHTGNLGTAIEGLSTPLLQLADHDYAIGKLVETLSHSPYWSSTAIIMIEDDPQDGQDHVEAHRSIIHIISPWTKSHAVVHTTYFTTSALRTVEDLLGVNHLGFNDANALPIWDAFTNWPTTTPYSAIIPGVLCAPPVAADLVPACKIPTAARSRRVADLHDAAWWAKATAGLDFSQPDHVNPQYYNQILEYGLTGRGSLPAGSTAALSSKDDDTGDADGDGYGK